MPWKKATPITLSEKQERILTEYAVGTHTPLHLKSRSQIVLNAAKGESNNTIEEAMGIDAKTVKLWRDRYSKQYEVLKKVELETPHKLRSSITDILSDAYRSGVTAKFKDDQVAAIIAISCEDPAKLGLSFSHWTPELLRIEVIKLGIVDNISNRQIGRFLKRKRFTTPSKPILA